MHRDPTTTDEAIAIRFVIHNLLKLNTGLFPRKRGKRGPRQGFLPGAAPRPRPQLGFA